MSIKGNDNDSGSYTIEDSIDAAILAGCTAITGDLTVQADGPTTLDLPVLASVSGFLSIEYNATLTTLDLPVLASVSGFLSVSHNATLTALDLPVLASLGDNLFIEDNANLPTCEADALRDQLLAAGFTGYVSISGNDDSGACP